MQEVSRRTKIALWLFTVLAVAFFAVDTRGAFIHYYSAGWEPHAMFHAITGLFYTQILCILVVILSWIPLRQGQYWSWWAVALIGIGIHGGHVVGDWLTDAGLRGQQAAQGAGIIFYSGTLLALFLYLVGLAMSYRHVRPEKA